MKMANIIRKITYKVLQNANNEHDFAQVTASWTFRGVD